MKDRTAARRVQKYRHRQVADRGIKRVEVQVPESTADDVKDFGRKLHTGLKNARTAEHQMNLALGTINAPRPQPIDAQTLAHCLLTHKPDERWRAHIEAFFDELAPEVIHDLVLAKVLTFEDLYRAARNWGVRDAANIAWIKEMADLRLARSAA